MLKASSFYGLPNKRLLVGREVHFHSVSLDIRHRLCQSV
jgi:hypothetical protein